MKYLRILLVFLFFTGVAAQNNSDVSRFKQVIDFKVRDIDSYGIVSFMTQDYKGGHTALFDEDGEIVEHRFQINLDPIDSSLISVEKTSLKKRGDLQNLIDGNIETNFVFDSRKNLVHSIILNFKEPQVVSGIEIGLSDKIIPPSKITLKTKPQDSDIWLSVLEDKPFKNILKFESVKTSQISLILTSHQLLSLSDIKIFKPQKDIVKGAQLIFFAYPQKKYKLYFDADFGQRKFITNSHPLKIDIRTSKFSLPKAENNPLYNPDFDGDSILDNLDLCPRIFDTENLDVDKNQRGDLCEDPDEDGIISSIDNCPFFYNPNTQEGDICSKEKIKRWNPILFILGGIFVFIITLVLWGVMKVLKDSQIKKSLIENINDKNDKK